MLYAFLVNHNLVIKVRRKDHIFSCKNVVSAQTLLPGFRFDFWCGEIHELNWKWVLLILRLFLQTEFRHKLELVWSLKAVVSARVHSNLLAFIYSHSNWCCLITLLCIKLPISAANKHVCCGFRDCWLSSRITIWATCHWYKNRSVPATKIKIPSQHFKIFSNIWCFSEGL